MFGLLAYVVDEEIVAVNRVAPDACSTSTSILLCKHASPSIQPSGINGSVYKTLLMRRTAETASAITSH